VRLSGTASGVPGSSHQGSPNKVDLKGAARAKQLQQQQQQQQQSQQLGAQGQHHQQHFHQQQGQLLHYEDLEQVTEQRKVKQLRWGERTQSWRELFLRLQCCPPWRQCPSPQEQLQWRPCEHCHGLQQWHPRAFQGRQGQAAVPLAPSSSGPAAGTTGLLSQMVGKHTAGTQMGGLSSAGTGSDVLARAGAGAGAGNGQGPASSVSLSGGSSLSGAATSGAAPAGPSQSQGPPAQSQVAPTQSQVAAALRTMKQEELTLLGPSSAPRPLTPLRPCLPPPLPLPDCWLRLQSPPTSHTLSFSWQ